MVWVDVTLLDSRTLEVIAFVPWWSFHDFVKVTSYFQRLINKNRTKLTIGGENWRSRRKLCCKLRLICRKSCLFVVVPCWKYTKRGVYMQPELLFETAINNSASLEFFPFIYSLQRASVEPNGQIAFCFDRDQRLWQWSWLITNVDVTSRIVRRNSPRIHIYETVLAIYDRSN